MYLILGAFKKLRKTVINFVISLSFRPSACLPPVPIELISQWTYIHEI
jgi:hypothetical protein